MLELRGQQETFNLGSSTFEAHGTSRLANAWVRIETHPSQTSEVLAGKEDTGNKILVPASLDGWVCVERPTMKWEDTLKVCQRARETVVRASSTLSPSTSLPDRSPVATPVTSKVSRKMDSSSPILPGQGAIYSPFPLPSKQSPRKISSGCVKARINASDSDIHQDPDLSIPKLENGKVQANNISAREKSIKSDDKGRNQEPANHDWVFMKESSREESSGDGITKEQDARMPDSCQSSTSDSLAPGGPLGSKEAQIVTSPGDTCMAWRLPELQEVNVKALGKDVKQSSMTEKNSVCGNFPEHPNCAQICRKSVAMEELGGVEERAISVEPPLSIEEQRVQTEDAASQDRKATSESYAGPQQHLNKVRRPRGSIIISKLTPSDLQKLTSRGDSLQVWKSFQDSLHQARKSFLIPTSLKEKFEQSSACTDRVTSTSIDDQFATSTRQVEIIFGEKSSTELPKKKSPPFRRVCCEDKFDGSGGEVSRANDSKILGHLGRGLKQVLSGAVILAGLFALWPKNGDPLARYHVVKAGETLSGIAPGQCTDPSSNFCRNNPRVCDQKTIYPGQRIRLS